MPRLAFLGTPRGVLFDAIGGRFPAYQLEAAYVFGHLSKEPSFSGAQMLPIALRSLLDELFSLDRGTPQSEAVAFDGTRKVTLLANSHRLEPTLRRQGSRQIVSVYSQVQPAGPKPTSLSAFEVVAQFLAFSHWHSITDVCFVRKGELLCNWRPLEDSVACLADRSLFKIQRSRITLSTEGLAPEIPKVAALGTSLDVELHAATDSLRSRLVPCNRQYPLATIIEACRSFPVGGAQRLSFNYALLSGVNDSMASARDVARLLHRIGRKAYVNLQLRPVPKTTQPQPQPQPQPPSAKAVASEFMAELQSCGVPCRIVATPQ